MPDSSSSLRQSAMNGNKPDTNRRSSFGRNFLSNLGNSLRGIHQEDTMLSNSPTIGNLAKYTDDHDESRSNGALQDISNSDEEDDDDANLYEDAQFVNNDTNNNNNNNNDNTINTNTTVNTVDNNANPNNINDDTNTNTNYNTINTIHEVPTSNRDIAVNIPIHKDILRKKENQSSSELSRKDTIIGNIPNQPFLIARTSQESDLHPIVDTHSEIDDANTNNTNIPTNSNDNTNISKSTSLKSSRSHDSPNDSQSTSESQTNSHDVIDDDEQQDQQINTTAVENDLLENMTGIDKDGFFSIRLTPLIDHSSSTSGLYFSPIIRKIKPSNNVSIGRYTEKNKAAAHAPQGSSAPIVFKSKVVSRTHALFQCNDIGQWFLKDCKSSSGTFLNHIRLSPASQESTLMPLIDGDIIQLGMDYRGGTEEVYRCVKMRCEFNKSWQRKVNQFNLEIHKKIKSLQINDNDIVQNTTNVLQDELSECAICLMKVDPCQALFMSPCSHAWHYKCIRPIIIKSYPQFYCPNCRTMCDLETDIEDD